MLLKQISLKIYMIIAIIFLGTANSVFSMDFGESHFYDFNYILSMLKIISSNPYFILSVFVSIVIAFLNRQIDNAAVLYKEVFIHAGVASILSGIFFLIFYTFGTDISDKSIINGTTETVFYEEPYTTYSESEVCDSEGKNCHTQTDYTRHPEKYFLNTSEGDQVSINEFDFKNYRTLFGNIRETDGNRYSMTASSKIAGEGDIWIIDATKEYPTAVSHKVTNFLRASKRDIFDKALTPPKSVQKYLVEYPLVHSSGFGAVEYTRFIDKVGLGYGSLEDKLDLLASRVGHRIQGNPILYIVPSNAGEKFPNYLEKHWGGFKKNDIVIIVWVDKSSNTITNSKVSSFSRRSLFNIELASNIIKGGLSEQSLLDSISKQLYLPTNAASGFERVPNEEYAYTVNDISFGFGWGLFLFLTIILSNVGISYYMHKNEYKNFRGFRR